MIRVNIMQSSKYSLTINLYRKRQLTILQIMNIDLSNALMEQNIPQPDNLQVMQMSDKLFYKGYRYFRICNMITAAYALGRIVASPVFFFMANDNQIQLSWWLACLFIISIFQLSHYYKMHKVASQVEVFIKLAGQMSHSSFQNMNTKDQYGRDKNFTTIQSRVHQTIDFSNPLALQIDDRKIKMLSLQIKFNMQKQNSVLFFTGKIQFAFYQIIHIWGFFILFSSSEQTTAGNYLVIILFLGTYQYLQFYILLIILVIVAPFLLLWHLVKYIVARKNKIDALKLLQEKDFSQQLQGDHECKICMAQYSKQDKIVVLKCSPMHHYHSQCIKSWVKVSPTCPVCRDQIGKH